MSRGLISLRKHNQEVYWSLIKNKICTNCRKTRAYKNITYCRKCADKKIKMTKERKLKAITDLSSHPINPPSGGYHRI